MNAHAKTVRERFGGEARNWNGLYAAGPSHSIYAHNVRRRKAHALALLDGATGRVLEIGCGAGNVILSAPPGSARAFGADFSIDMLRQAKAKAGGRPLGLMAADALRLPIRNGTFGAVLCLGVLDYIPDCRTVLKECYRILEPGGRLIVSVPNTTSPFVWIDDLGFGIKNAVTHSLPGRLRVWLKTRLLGREDRPYFNHRKHRYNPQAFAACLEQIGFTVEQTRYHTYGFGLLNGTGLNVRLSERLESRARSRTLEKFGWTHILKANRPQQP